MGNTPLIELANIEKSLGLKARLYAKVELALKEENKDKNIVVLFPDGGDRYLSTELFQE